MESNWFVLSDFEAGFGMKEKYSQPSIHTYTQDDICLHLRSTVTIHVKRPH